MIKAGESLLWAEAWGGHRQGKAELGEGRGTPGYGLPQKSGGEMKV